MRSAVILTLNYWHEYLSEAKLESPEAGGNPYDWVDDNLIPEDRVDCRAGSGTCENVDFFEMLKANFRTLNFV